MIVPVYRRHWINVSSRSPHSPFKVDDEVEIILRQAMAAVRARRGAILLLDRDERTPEVKGTQGYDRTEVGPRLGDRHRISDRLPLVDPVEPDAPMAIRMYEDLERGTVFVPMVAKERLVGGIDLVLEGSERRLTPNDQKPLYALTAQAAIFLENARLERDVRSMFLNIIVSMAGAVDAKDAYTHGHSPGESQPIISFSGFQLLRVSALKSGVPLGA